MSVAVTQARLDALEEAIATGVSEFTFDGQATKYRSLDEMYRARDFLLEKIKGASVANADNGVWFSDHDKGYS